MDKVEWEYIFALHLLDFRLKIEPKCRDLHINTEFNVQWKLRDFKLERRQSLSTMKLSRKSVVDHMLRVEEAEVVFIKIH